MLSVSEATIRRDLTELKKQGLVERSHGGAVLTSNGGEISIFARMNKSDLLRRNTMLLIHENKTNYHILIEENASESIRTSALSLQALIKRCTGAETEICTEIC